MVCLHEETLHKNHRYFYKEVTKSDLTLVLSKMIVRTYNEAKLNLNIASS